MLYVKPNHDWIHHRLAEDIVSKNGTLLLSKGHLLTNEDLKTILDWNIEYIVIEESSPTDSAFSELYDTCLSTVEHSFQTVANGGKLEKEPLFEMFDHLLNQMFTTPSIFIQLRTIKEINKRTFQHSLNVGALSALLARLYGFEKEDITRMGHAGFLHDIGKALIPESILNKPGELDEKEYEIMKRHPELGYDILKKNNIDDEYILSAVLLHNERLNGTGYPFGKKEQGIPLPAQIVAIADVYDSISTDKEYKKSLSPFHAYMELQNLAFKGELNPKIVLKFLEYISKLMEGKKVLLNDGTIGKVIFSTPYEPNRPLIEVNGAFIDLRKNREIYIQELLVNL